MTTFGGRWRGSTSLSIALALAASVFFALVFWIWERSMLWMLAVVLPPIWSPVIVQRVAGEDGVEADRRLIAALLIGLALLVAAGLVAYQVG